MARRRNTKLIRVSNEFDDQLKKIVNTKLEAGEKITKIDITKRLARDLEDFSD